MRRSFVLTLLSSWLVNPLGILVAHAAGFANASEILLLLLATGAGAPFQIFLNECLAAAVERGKVQPGKANVFFILAAQICTTIVALLFISGSNHLFIALLTITLALSNFLSYKVSSIYYRLVVLSLITPRQAIFVGATPGIATLAQFILYCAAAAFYPKLSSIVILSIALLPTLIQWLYVQELSRPRNGAPSGFARHTAAGAKELALTSLLTPLVLLCMLTAIGTLSRESIGRHGEHYMALILVGLNSLISLANTFTRIDFLSKKRSQTSSSSLIAIFSLFFIGFLSIGLITSTFLPFTILAFSQLSIVLVIQFGRHKLVSR